MKKISFCLWIFIALLSLVNLSCNIGTNPNQPASDTSSKNNDSASLTKDTNDLNQKWIEFTQRNLTNLDIPDWEVPDVDASGCFREYETILKSPLAKHYTDGVRFGSDSLRKWLDKVLPLSDSLRIQFGIYTDTFLRDQINNHHAPADLKDVGRLTVFLVPYNKGKVVTQDKAGQPVNDYNLGNLHP